MTVAAIKKLLGRLTRPSSERLIGARFAVVAGETDETLGWAVNYFFASSYSDFSIYFSNIFLTFLPPFTFENFSTVFRLFFYFFF